MIDYLADFEKNKPLFPRDEIPDSFVIQIYKFVKELNILNNNSIEAMNIIYRCLSFDDPKINEKIKCDIITDQDKLNIIKNTKYRAWIRHFHFK